MYGTAADNNKLKSISKTCMLWDNIASCRLLHAELILVALSGQICDDQSLVRSVIEVHC